MKLNPQQQDAVNHKDGPILILAGAGSGKTRVIVNRIVKLIESDAVPPWQILAVTFTNKAANEMRERITVMLGLSDTCPVTIGTFHALCVRILRREHPYAGLGGNFTICDDTEQLSRIKRAMTETGVSPDRLTPKSIQATISRAKNDFLSPQKMKQDAGKNMYLSLAAEVYAVYETGLRADQAVDFDDLIVRTVRLFRDEPAVLEKYQNRYRYILIDEYQDTNNAQYQLVLLLAQRYRNIMAVGDDDQSIYRWRGAEVSNILNFSRDFPGTKTIKLEQNYRSTQVILSAASALMTHNTHRTQKTLWTDRQGGELIQVGFWESDRREAEQVATAMQQLVNEGYAWEDFAIFYRTNAQSRVFEEHFQNSGIPYRVIGNISFFRRREVKDLLAYIRITLNPSDSAALLRIINVPRRGIGKKTIDIITQAAATQATDHFSAIEH
nr:UvrD-helicase domain-containing protein [bacterium]